MYINTVYATEQQQQKNVVTATLQKEKHRYKLIKLKKKIMQ